MRIKYLDSAVLFFAGHKKFCDDQDLRGYLLNEFNDKEINQNIIIEKLLKDGYLISREQKMVNSLGSVYYKPHYCISYDGLLFLKKSLIYSKQPYKNKSIMDK